MNPGDPLSTAPEPWPLVRDLTAEAAWDATDLDIDEPFLAACRDAESSEAMARLRDHQDAATDFGLARHYGAASLEIERLSAIVEAAREAVIAQVERDRQDAGMTAHLDARRAAWAMSELENDGFDG